MPERKVEKKDLWKDALEAEKKAEWKAEKKVWNI